MQFFNFLYEDSFPIFPITQVFFLSIIYSISSVLDESGNSGEESKSQQAFFYTVITIFLIFDCFLFWLNPNEAREWISAIGLPITTFIVAYFLNKRQKDREKNREDSNRKQEILKNYLSEMSGLLKDQDLNSIQPNSSVANLCKAFTISTLSQLDSERNILATAFLTQMGITTNQWGILKGAHFPKTNFVRALLNEANLTKANFESADLSRANLNKADLRNAELMYAKFNYTYLKGANLKEANLEMAELEGAVLNYAILNDSVLSKVNLEGAFLVNSHLEWADLEEANLKEG